MSRTNRVYRVAIIPGDGIGKEVVPEGVRVLEAAAKRFGFEIDGEDVDFASCDYYQRHGRMMPEDWKDDRRARTRSSSARSAGRRRCRTMSRSGAR